MFKAKILKSDLIPKLNMVVDISGRKTNLSITECVSLKTNDVESSVQISGTNLETDFGSTISASEVVSGEVAIPARKLRDIVQSIPGQSVLIHEIESRWIKITSDEYSGEFTIGGFDADDFPVFMLPDELEFFELDTDIVLEYLSRGAALKGVSNDKRAHIQGILFQRFNTNSMCILSTDGSRLIRSYIHNHETEFPEFDDILIPKEEMRTNLKFITPGMKIQMALKNNHLVIKSGADQMTARALEGDFPDSKPIFNAEFKYQITLELKPFMQVLSRAEKITNDSYRSAILKFTQSGIDFWVTNPDMGEFKESMPVENMPTITDDFLEGVAFNVDNFIDLLKSDPSENIILNLNNHTKACVIGSDDPNVSMVIMPMKL